MLQGNQTLPNAPITIICPSSPTSDVENSAPPALWILTPPASSEDVEISAKSSPLPDSKSEEPGRRKSRRLHKEPFKNDNELLANFHDGTGVLDRGTVIPVGLGHTPFQFKVKVDENLQREQNKLKIAMVPNFNNKNLVAKYESKCTLEAKEDAEIRVGDEFQAVIDDSLPAYPEDQEELMWSPPPGDVIDHATCRNEYYRCIWRQYEGQVPFEVALQNLMQSEYDFGKSLETIDHHLMTLPQKMKPLAEVQYRRFEELLEDKVFTRRALQEKCMRNYHISEIQDFYHKFKNYYLSLENTESCTCRDPLCKPVDCQPRWACPNCTKNLKPSSCDAPDSSQLCFICQTYSSLTGEVLPATDVVFSDEDVKKILEWKRIEEEKGGVQISKEEFEKILKETTIKRWMSNELTDEEYDVIDATKLPHRRRRKNKLTEEEKADIGMMLAEQLEPHPIPLFKICEAEKKFLEDQKLEEEESQALECELSEIES